MSTSSTTYLVATSTPPEIVCPPWCTYTKKDHLDELANWEGCCVHSGETVFRTSDDREVTVYLGLESLPDGTDDPEGGIRGVTVRVESFGDFMSAADAIAFGTFLVEFTSAAIEGRS